MGREVEAKSARDKGLSQTNPAAVSLTLSASANRKFPSHPNGTFPNPWFSHCRGCLSLRARIRPYRQAAEYITPRERCNRCDTERDAHRECYVGGVHLPQTAYWFPIAIFFPAYVTRPAAVAKCA